MTDAELLSKRISNIQTQADAENDSSAIPEGMSLYNDLCSAKPLQTSMLSGIGEHSTMQLFWVCATSVLLVFGVP